MNGPSSALAPRNFSTCEAPVSHRSTVFRDRMAKSFSIGLDVKPVGRRELDCTVEGYWGPGLKFASLRLSPHTTEPAKLACEQPSLLISLHREGAAYVSQDGRESEVGPGDMFLIDPTRPFSIETGEIFTTSLYVARSAVRALIPEIDSFTSIAIPTDSGPAALFRAFFDELFRIAPQLDARAADRVVDTVPFVLATALGSIDVGDHVAPNRTQAAHKQRVLRFIRENLQDPELNPAKIAQGVGLSSRYIYDLFADEPVALMRRVWRERLERCRNELTNPQMAETSIGEIAFNWGFSDTAHFSRVFRQQFGLTPREARSLGASAGVERASDQSAGGCGAVASARIPPARKRTARS